jgi:hypothetical protein
VYFSPRKLVPVVKSTKVLKLTEKFNWWLRPVAVQLWHVQIIHKDDHGLASRGTWQQPITMLYIYIVTNQNVALRIATNKTVSLLLLWQHTKDVLFLLLQFAFNHLLCASAACLRREVEKDGNVV